jgi:hypothetical protein
VRASARLVSRRPYSTWAGERASRKFFDDLEGVTVNAAVGMAFVTNQELRESERKFFQRKAGPITIRLYHLDRLVTILDSPPMTGVREQLLHIPDRSVEGAIAAA